MTKILLDKIVALRCAFGTKLFAKYCLCFIKKF